MKAILPKQFRWVLPIAAFVLFGALFSLLGRFTNPAKYAMASQCIERSDVGRTYTNSCDFGINLSLCLADGDEANYSNCPVTLLSEGESLALTDSELFETDRYGNRHLWACKAPFVPRMNPSPNNSALLREGCSKAGGS